MDTQFPRTPENRRPVGRLLEEISWDGGRCTRLRDAERGKENMLTTEVFQALDLLPRSDFLARLPLNGECGGESTRRRFAEEAEDFEITILPGSVYLNPSESVYSRALPVQPDVLLQSDSMYGYVEAKAIAGQPGFQVEQLARQFLAVHHYAGVRLPFMLLVLPAPPPIPVKSQGRKLVVDAIEDDLASVLCKSELSLPDDMDVRSAVSESVHWTTWGQIARMVQARADEVMSESVVPLSMRRSVMRTAAHLIDSIEWHASR